MWLGSLLLVLLMTAFGHAQEEEPTPTPATIPGAASSHADFALGYLHCDLYPGVDKTGGGSAATNTAQIQICIDDAWANALTAYLACGTYLINDTLKLYEWQNWSGSAALQPDPRNHSLRGSKVGGCQPTLKLAASSSGFTSAASPRPMLAVRNFEALNSSAVANTPPSNPLGLPANFRDKQQNHFAVVIENLHFDTTTNAGAIGVAFPSAQNSGLYNIKVTATSSFAGVYGLPGRNSVVGKLEVIGGQHCLGGGSVWGLGLDNSIGNTLAGITCTNQTDSAIEIHDTVPTVITGLAITKSTTGAPIRVRSPMALIDARIDLSGSAANILAIDNVDGRTLYVRNVTMSGTTQLIKSGTCPTCTTTGAGSASRATEYAYTDQFQKDGSTAADVFPPNYAVNDTQFETRSVINGALTQNALPITPAIVSNASAPASDLVSRHVWASLPSFEDGAFTNPDDPIYGDCDATVITPGYGQDGADANSGPDCTAELQAAIDAAQTAGHNRVHLPRGVIAISGSVNLHADTKLMGAGIGLINMIAYKSNWNPTTETYLITTDNSLGGAAYMGFFSLFVRTQPLANQFTSHFHWRVGKNSMTINLGYEKQHQTPNVDTNALKMVRFSGNGGGKHYGIHNSFEQYDSNPGARMIYAENTTQPLTLYGQNLEITKASVNADHWADANLEFVNVSNARVYGCKREGQAPTAIITDSDNIALYGCGLGTIDLRPGKNGWLQFTGATSNVLAAVQQSNKMTSLPIPEMVLREAISPAPTPGNAGSIIPWPNGLSLYKRGQTDDTPFGTAPSATAPEFLSAEVNVADTLDVCWKIFDNASLQPASDTTGWTVNVDGASKPVASSALQALNCYRLTFAGGTITNGAQVVVVSYSGGNIVGGGTGNPPATAFSDQTAVNKLSPAVAAALTQTAYVFRRLYGGMDATSSPFYTESTGTSSENVPGRFIQGGRFRVHLKVANNNANAPTRALYVCYEEEAAAAPSTDAGTYIPLTDSCATANTCFADAPDLADGAPTIELLTPTESTFVPGGLLESAGSQVLVTLPQNSETGMEAAVQFKSTAPVNNRYRYRICEAGGVPLSGYPQTALATVITLRSSQSGGGTRK